MVHVHVWVLWLHLHLWRCRVEGGSVGWLADGVDLGWWGSLLCDDLVVVV